MTSVQLGILLIVAMVAVCIALLVLSLHKTRKIHLASYQLLEDVAAIRQETNALFSQLQALWALERKLQLSEALPPMRGWAGSPDFLLAAAEETLCLKPTTVMECSSGVSTVVMARCLQMNGVGHVYSLENSVEFANKTREMLAKHGLTDWATVLDAPLVADHTQTPWYDEGVIPKNMPPVDLLIIDGPPGFSAPLARYPALPRLQPRLSDRCVVLVDDADRPDEVEMVKRWMKEFPQFERTDLPAEKGLVMLKRGIRGYE